MFTHFCSFKHLFNENEKYSTLLIKNCKQNTLAKRLDHNSVGRLDACILYEEAKIRSPSLAYRGMPECFSGEFT